MTIKLSATDLNYLLTQVNIGINYDQLSGPLDPSGVREVDGSNNNLVGAYDVNGVFQPGANINGDWGRADTDFLRMFATDHPEGPAAGVIYTYANVSKVLVNDANGVAPGGAGYIPTFGNAPMANITFDGTPRLISQLIASSDVTPGSPTFNPAAFDAMTNLGGAPVDVSNSVVGTTQTAAMPNPGILGGVPYNEWFVAFGQFFDHGLDFISKGGGYVMIPILPNDPLYVVGGQNMMMLNRASLSNPAADFNLDGTLKDGVVPTFNNNTGLMIDQSQTYGSSASVNALLRQYDASGVLTGRLIDGSEDGSGATNELATWADMKVNAARIGVVLSDLDVLDAPMLRVNGAGAFLPGVNLDGTPYTSAPPAGWTGLANQAANDPFMRDEAGNALTTGHPILADIAFGADPSQPHGAPFSPAALAAHYVSGDGRVNENVGLTAVHHVFHEEHNIQVAAVQAAVLEQAALLDDGSPAGGQAEADYLANWQTAPGVWDGEKVYQAARIITESEYNHIAIDQYVGGLYPALPEFVSYSADINLSVSLEFSQAVFRLGHSQLSETMQFAIADGNGILPGQPGWTPTYNEQGLFDAFLNPALYDQFGAAGITLGLMNQQGNEIDEFVTAGVQQSLLGVPLDLPALNIARGRDVGLPTLNELRLEIYDGLNQVNPGDNGSGIAPYTSWADFGGHMKNPASLVNFIAAYARDVGDIWGIATARAAYLAGTGTLQAIRDAAQNILDEAALGNLDAVGFLQGSPVYDPETRTWSTSGTGDQGFWDIDLWIGGLAEQALFDGPLGTTFSFVMLDFAQRMQDGDRFYYLYRMPVGQHLGDQIIGEQFADMIQRTTGLTHTGDAFAYQSGFYELDNGHNYWNAIYETLPDGSSANDGHIVVAGNDGDDYIIGALGDDVIYGDAGNDVIEGAQGNDHIYGGLGDDYITDYENDDFISGGEGNDTIFAGPGVLDTIHGNDGDDELYGGDGIDEVFGDDGNDRLYGGGDTDLMMGGEGSDFMDGGDSVDEMFGGNGNDWMRGGVGDDHMNGGSGNDLMEGGLGPAANDGDRYFGDSPLGLLPVIEWNGDGTEGDMDIASYENAPIAIFASLQTSNASGTSSNLLDTYAFDEGLVGSRFDDILQGAGDAAVASNGPNNYLVGGAGNDRLEGLGGDDFLFGDSVIVNNDLHWIGDVNRLTFVDHGAVTGYIENWYGTGDTRVQFADGTLGHILGDNGADGNADVAVFSGHRDDYTIETISYVDANGQTQSAQRVTDNGSATRAASDGTDILVGIERLEFLGGGAVLVLTDIQWNGLAPIGNALPGAGATIANLSVVDPNNLPWSFATTSTQFSISAAGAVTANSALANNTSYTFTVDAVDTSGATYSETFNIRTGGNGNNSGATTSFPQYATVGDDIFYARNGNDTMDGGLGGDDTFYGQGGNDVMTGGAGNDLLDGGAGSSDRAIFAGPLANYSVAQDGNGDLVVTDNVGNDGSDTLRGVEQVTFDGASYELVVGSGNPGAPLPNLSGFSTNDLIINFDADRPVFGGDGGDVIYAGGGNLRAYYGGDGNDLLVGDAVDNTLRSEGGEDTIQGGDGNDTLIGGDGGDSIDGGGGNDWIGGDIGNSAASDGADTIDGGAGDDWIAAGGGADIVFGGAGIDEIRAGDGDDVIEGGSGNDLIYAQGGDDTIIWNNGDGRDVVHGEANGPTGDLFVVNGDAGGIVTETFNIYSNRDVVPGGTSASTLIPGGYTGFAAIVITRTVGTTTTIIAELTGIEEIQINTVDPTVIGSPPPLVTPTGDIVNVHGDFTNTGLYLNTITIQGSTGDDMVDISGLSSDHRIVFRTFGGNDTIIGDLRPNDVIEVAPGSAYTASTEGGMTTLSDGSNTISFTGSKMPVVQDTDGTVLDVAMQVVGLPADPGDNTEAPAGPPAADPVVVAAHDPSIDALIGSNAADVLNGDAGIDLIMGEGGQDRISGGNGADDLFGNDDNDVIYGDSGADRLFGGNGDDVIDGGADGDIIFGDDGDDFIDGGSGSDMAWGGEGKDVFRAAAGDGNDWYHGGDGTDTLDLRAIDAAVTVDLNNGSTGFGRAVSAETGTDMLDGIENVIGGSGNDTFIASDVANLLSGGDGNDTFRFDSAAKADGDVIGDFTTGDKIDLSAIDAISGNTGHDGFTLLTQGVLTSAGQVMLRVENGGTFIDGNIDGDASTIEFSIEVVGVTELKATDFNGLV